MIWVVLPLFTLLSLIVNSAYCGLSVRRDFAEARSTRAILGLVAMFAPVGGIGMAGLGFLAGLSGI